MENNRAEELESFIELNRKKIHLLDVEIKMFEAELRLLSVKRSVERDLVHLAHVVCNLEAEVVLMESKLDPK